MKVKKAQITIFLIIVLIIVVLFISLASYKKQTDEDRIDIPIKNEDNKNDELINIKTKIDHCLSRNLKNALIIAGLRGGYIYRRDEYYIQGIIPKNTYNEKLISNLGLNWNFLSDKAMAYSYIYPQYPQLEKNTLTLQGETVFSHTIKEDIEDYVRANFLNCLDFSNFQGYETNFNQYLGQLKHIDYSKKEIVINNIDADINDTIMMLTNNQKFTGKIIKKDETNAIFTAHISEINNLENREISDFNNFAVVNINKSPILNISINEESVSINSLFTINVYDKNSKHTITYQSSSIKNNIRLKTLLDFAKILINEKYYKNKMIDYLDSSSFINTMSKSEYFKRTMLKDISLNVKIIKNDNEHKKFMYSLIDRSSIIDGNPYVLNFGYENMAPKINFSELDVIENDDEITFVCAKNYFVSYNLTNYTKDIQFYDNHLFYFIEDSYDSTDGQFSITKDGIMSFKAFREKIYTFIIQVTDGETKRDYKINFITGVTDNANNTDAKNCFKFSNYPDSNERFPIHATFKDKIYERRKGSQKAEAFGLVPYFSGAMQDSEPKNSKLSFLKSCIFSDKLFEIKFYEKSEGSSDFSEIGYSEDKKGYSIDIKPDGKLYEYKVDVFLKHDPENPVSESFIFKAYPAYCLGPNVTDSMFNATCCDINKVDSDVKAYEKGSANSLNLLDPKILKKGETALDTLLYICYRFTSKDNEISEKILWNIHPEITSLLKAKIVIKCEGNLPRGEDNLQEFGYPSGINFGTIEKFFIEAKSYKPQKIKSLNLLVQQHAEKCQACELKTTGRRIETKYMDKTLLFDTGLLSENTGQLVGPVTSYSNHEFQTKNVFCDEKWYYTQSNPQDSAGWKLLTSTVGKNDAKPTNIYLSQGYCKEDGKCAGLVNSPSYKSKSDNIPICYDFFTSLSLLPEPGFDSIKNTGWSCGSGKKCLNGECK